MVKLMTIPGFIEESIASKKDIELKVIVWRLASDSFQDAALSSAITSAQYQAFQPARWHQEIN
jgi:hypothetical protein